MSFILKIPNYKKLKNKLPFFVSIVILMWVVFVNRFPHGYVYSSGDFAQPIDLDSLFDNMFYTWGNKIAFPGEGGFFSWFAAVPYYFLFYYIPFRLGFSGSSILSIVFFLFLLFSYLSFSLSLKLLFGNKPKETFLSATFPLVYALNTTTWYFFSYTWGFSHQVFIYITLPLLTALFYKFLKSFSLKTAIPFLLVLFMSASGFTNSAFFFSLFLYLFILFVVWIVVRQIRITLRSVFALSLLIIASFFLLGYWLFPTLFLVKENLQGLAQGVFNLNSWLNMQAADILSVFTGFPGYKAFFPFKYDLKILYLFPFIPFIYLSILLANFGKARDTVDKRFSVSFLIVGLIFIVLLKKSFPPFGSLTVMLFNLPLLPVLRSYEKIAVFMPFTIFTAIYGLICPQWLKDKKMLLGIPLVFLGVLPFFIGGLQKEYTIAHTQANDYLTSDYSSLVKIPSDYYEQAAFSNTMPEDTKIQASPYCALGSDSWAYYPKWGLRGFNPAEILFEKPTIAQSMSSYNLYGWNPNLTFNELNFPPLWYPKLLSFFNVSHILYHKDVAPEFIVKSYPKYDYLEKTGRLSKERETENLIFYSLDKDKYESPHLYVTHNKIEIYDSYESLPYVLSLEDFPTKSYFEVNSNGPDSKDSEIYSVLTRNPSVLDLQNLNWDFNWAWDVPLHDISLIEHKLLRKQEARAESSAVDWQEKIDVKLSNLVKRAFDVSEHNKLYNVSLSEDFVSEFSEIKEIISMNLEHYKAPYYAEKIFKYLLMIRNKFGAERTYEFYSSFINDFYTFLESTDLLECSGLCYSAFVPRAGDYEILVVGEDLDGISLFRKDSFGERELEEVSSGMEGSAYFGKSSFGENSQVSLRLKFDGTKNLISGAPWAKYSGSLKDRFDVATSDSGYDIFYKEIAMWDSSSNYSISFDYNAGDLDFYFFIVESPTTIGKDTSFDMEQFLENPEIYEYTEVPSYSQKFGIEAVPLISGEWSEYKMLYSPKYAISSNPSIVIISKGNPSNFIKDLKVQKTLEPKIILRRKFGKGFTQEELPSISVAKINPTKYEVEVKSATSPYKLIFSEAFNAGWGLHLSSGSEHSNAGLKVGAALFNFIREILGLEDIAKNQHFLANGYANGWEILPSNVGGLENYTLILEFRQQKIYYLGVFSSGLLLAFLCGYLVFSRKKNGSKQRK